jgi:hypothetical protein
LSAQITEHHIWTLYKEVAALSIPSGTSRCDASRSCQSCRNGTAKC